MAEHPMVGHLAGGDLAAMAVLLAFLGWVTWVMGQATEFLKEMSDD